MRKGPEQEPDGGKNVAFGMYFQAATQRPMVQDPCMSCPGPWVGVVRLLCAIWSGATLQTRQVPAPGERGQGDSKSLQSKESVYRGNLKECADNKLNKLTSDSFS